MMENYVKLSIHHEPIRGHTYFVSSPCSSKFICINMSSDFWALEGLT